MRVDLVLPCVRVRELRRRSVVCDLILEKPILDYKPCVFDEEDDADDDVN